MANIEKDLQEALDRVQRLKMELKNKIPGSTPIENEQMTLRVLREIEKNANEILGLIKSHSKEG